MIEREWDCVARRPVQLQLAAYGNSGIHLNVFVIAICIISYQYWKMFV